MSFDVRNLFRKVVSNVETLEESAPQFRKSLKERLLEAQLISDNTDELSKNKLFNK